MDCRYFFRRQRAILFAPASDSGASIGQECTIVDIDPETRRQFPDDATHWRVRIFLPHVPEYREVRARDLLGLQERDDSELPPPRDCRPRKPQESLPVMSKQLAEFPPPQVPSQYNRMFAAAFAACFVG
jgi:hypothetical protein